MMPSCSIGESGDPLSKCFGTLRTNLDCTVPQATVEDVGVLTPYNDHMGGTLKALPGCNPVSKGPERATIQKDCAGVDYGTTTTGTTPSANNTSGSTPSEASSVAAVVATSAAANSSDVSMGYAPATSVSAPAMSVYTTAASSSGSASSDSVYTAASSSASASSDTASMSAISTPLTTSPSSGGYNSSSPSSGSSGSCDKSNFGGSWKYLGCFADDNDRVMRGIHLANLGYQNVTSTGCAAYCDGEGFHYSGTEAGGQCFCSHDAPKKTSDNCNVCCEGKAGKNEVCGGGWALSVYAKPGSMKRAHRHRRGVHQFAKLS